MSSTNKRKILTLKEKLEVLKETKVKSQRDVASKFGISLGTVNRIVQKKREFESLGEDNFSPNAKRIKKSNVEDVNDAVWQWFVTARNKNVPVSGPLIQEKARKIAEECGVTNFKASNGWLDRFRTRNNIKFKVLSGESAGVDPETVTTWKQRLDDIVDEYSADDIFNCDETGLFYRAMPNKSLVLPTENGHGTKVPKDRITVLLGANMSGTEKLKPLVIGKSAKPRCFKHKNPSDFPVIWKANKKAWMTTLLFDEWVKDLNNSMKKKDRKIILFVDNASSHATVELSNVCLKFFPANCTSELQPMDQGIIKALKSGYRQRLLKSILAKMESEEAGDKIVCSITVLDAIYWISQAWDDINPETIQKCFSRCGFTFFNGFESIAIEQDTQQCELQELVDQAACALNIAIGDAEEYVNIDSDTQVHIGESDDWEKDLADAEKPEETDDEPCVMSCPTKKEVIRSLDILKAYVASDSEAYRAVMNTESHIHRIILKSARTKQSVLTDYFGKVNKS